MDNLAINAIRVLSADMTQKANSGHPGLPLGAAPAAYTLWAEAMNHNPGNPGWLNRDRFVLSAGHGSSMPYALLHLLGYEGMSLEELKSFRQWGSLTPGHPEYRHTAGVEATTGPLGAGLGLAVGMAMAEAHLAETFNRPDFPVFDHYTYVLCGDGCLMEGISYEVLSLAGTLGLHKLIVLYDSNRITIEGNTELAFTEDVEKRFDAFGFQVLTVTNGNDPDAIQQAVETAKSDQRRPSFIKMTTTIGYGVPVKEGTPSAHGEPLGEENAAILRERLGWPLAENFAVPQEVYDHYQNIRQKGEAKEAKWNKLLAEYALSYPERKDKLDQYYSTGYQAKVLDTEEFWTSQQKPDATRNISGRILNMLKDYYPNLLGGSADLGPSNKTIMYQESDFAKANYAGRNIHFGVRELGMTAIANGILLHGGLKTYIASFFVFADYMKPMVRLSGLMRLPLIMIMTHDSIGVGEDGPTHEPVEQLAMLRAQPNVNVFRPADETETKAAWYAAVTSVDVPTVLVLSRQNLPVLMNSGKEALKGGYILERESGAEPEVILMASGSEVQLAVTSKISLEQEGHSVRVVSMPCMEIFEQQSEAYKEEVLPCSVRKRAVIEAGSRMPWGAYVGMDGVYVTMDCFGASAPASKLFEEFGFTAEHVCEVVREII